MIVLRVEGMTEQEENDENHAPNKIYDETQIKPSVSSLKDVSNKF